MGAGAGLEEAEAPLVVLRAAVAQAGGTRGHEEEGVRVADEPMTRIGRSGRAVAAAVC